jgi:hypothetical protein
MPLRHLRNWTVICCLGIAGLPGIAAAAGPIATTDGEAPGTRVDVQELKRVSGGTVMLKFTLVNDSDKPMDSNQFYSQEYHSADGAYLVDLAGKKKYEVVRDSEKHCVCSRDIPTIKAKSSVNLWAKFPAPAEGVDKIGVVVPHFIPLDDVPLAK